MHRSGEKDAALTELHIGRIKKEIDDLLVRFHTENSSDPETFWSLRIAQAKLSLRSCREIASYVGKTSPAVANELNRHLRSASASLRKITRSHDTVALQNWYKIELAPVLNKAEQEAYLLASARRKAAGDEDNQFAWKVGETPGGEEHIKRFGKSAEEFKYLDHACPVCGGRIDEMGWCGCGNIGGG